MSRSKRLRSVGLDDLEAIMREWLEAYDSGWKPEMHIPAVRDGRADQVRSILKDMG